MIKGIGGKGGGGESIVDRNSAVIFGGGVVWRSTLSAEEGCGFL